MVVPIKLIDIENFRGIRKATIDLHPKVTVFFGANAAGKTTVLHALAIGLGAITSRVPKGEARSFSRSNDIRVPWLDRQDIGEVQNVQRPYARVELTTAANSSWSVMRLRSEADRATAPASVGTDKLYQFLDPLIREILDAPPNQRTRSFPLVAAYGNERAGVEIPRRERSFNTVFKRLDALDQALSATTKFKTVFEWFRVTEDEERRERERRQDFGFKLPTLEWVRRAIANAGLRCANPRVDTQPLKMKVDFTHENGAIEPLDIDSLSDGYRTHFALIVDIARRMVQLNPSDDLNDLERGTNSPAIILIDEVDLHLDPPWQGRVVVGLCNTFPNAQFVLTTHSEQVIGSVDASSVRRLVWENGEIIVQLVPFAQGASNERILIDFMNAPERVPGPNTEKLSRYLQMVSRGEGTTPDALVLRADLEFALPGDEALQRADIEMNRQSWLAKLGKTNP